MYVLTQTAEALDYEAAGGEGEDEQLVARICAGERALFAKLYGLYYPRAFALAFGMTGRREQADDLTQEIFMRAYERLASYNGRASFSTWFYRLAVNQSLNYCRRERRHKGSVSDSGDVEGLASAASGGAGERMEAALLRQQVQLQVRQALLTLKPEMRVLIVMKEIEGLSYEEISERLDCSMGTVASGLSRARRLLARKLENLKGKI
ncbi:MAG TPA: sigma-70 family RNA polymerase sigma factor [Pyrinomonadaceae bacterium]|jgi:RNA polymerase sigma-70 factor (ECF subfamily)